MSALCPSWPDVASQTLRSSSFGLDNFMPWVLIQEESCGCQVERSVLSWQPFCNRMFADGKFPSHIKQQVLETVSRSEIAKIAGLVEMA